MASFENQFAYQHAYAFGTILNVGCDSDSSNLKGRGAVNVDIWKHNPYTNFTIPADVLADVRDLSVTLEGEPTGFYGQFDCVICGDILEHFVHIDDIDRALQQCRLCLRPGGRIIITCPEDTRPPTEQVKGEQPMYSEDVRAYHAYPVTRELMEEWCARNGLKVAVYAKINYGFCPNGGHGIVAEPVEEETLRVVQEQEAGQ
jgi:SAM-dependent methyltransferase